jgi:hypothetical protein
MRIAGRDDAMMHLLLFGNDWKTSINVGFLVGEATSGRQRQKSLAAIVQSPFLTV